MECFRLFRVCFYKVSQILTTFVYVPRVLLHPKYLLIHVYLYIFVYYVVVLCQVIEDHLVEWLFS